MFDWQAFLQKWVEDSDNSASTEPGATEDQIAVLETRIGKSLPPSYRAFLAVSNGFNYPDGSIDRIRPAEEVDWLAVENQELIDIWLNPEMVELDPEIVHFKTTLQISDEGDAAFMLLNPNVIDEATGEWEAWFFASWVPGETKYPSFQHLMEERYKTMLYVKADQEQRAKVANAPKDVKEALGGVADQWQKIADQMQDSMSEMFNMETLMKMLIPDADQRAKMQGNYDELKSMMDDFNQKMMNFAQQPQDPTAPTAVDPTSLFGDADANTAKFQKLMETIRADFQESSPLADIKAEDLPDLGAMNDALMQLGMMQGLNMAAGQLRNMLNIQPDDPEDEDEENE